VLADHDVVVGDGGLETRVELLAEGVGLEGAAGQSVGLAVGHVLPAGEGVAVDRLVHAVVDWDVVLSGGGDEFLDVGEGVVCFHAVGHLSVEFAIWVEELVVGVDEEDGGGVGHCKGVWSCSVLQAVSSDRTQVSSWGQRRLLYMRALVMQRGIRAFSALKS
jgi:hypothetical protein